MPVMGMRPCVGLKPMMPVCAAGPRMEMARSVPRPSGDMPAAIAADSPPEDPPGVRSRFHGLLERPVSRLSLSVEYENSGRFVLASRMPPAAFSRATLVASASGVQLRKIGEPRWVGTPAVSMESLAVNGTPCSGPSASPARMAASAARAEASASCATDTIAFTFGLTAAMRSRWAWTISTGETSRVRISSARRVASCQKMSVSISVNLSIS